MLQCCQEIHPPLRFSKSLCCLEQLLRLIAAVDPRTFLKTVGCLTPYNKLKPKLLHSNLAVSGGLAKILAGKSNTKVG